MLYYKRGKRDRNSVQHVILKAVGEASLLTRERLIESVLQLFDKKATRKTDPRYDIPRGVRRLVERGFVCIQKRRNEEVLTLTPKGEELLIKLTQRRFASKKPKQWDKKWRIVIYDIKEDRKRMRRSLRGSLVYFGFVPVQKSVWVYPYPCEDLLAMIKADFRVGKEVLYLVVDKLENDLWLKKHFAL